MTRIGQVHLCRAYNDNDPSISNFYAARFICAAAIGTQVAAQMKFSRFGAVMKKRFQSRKEDNPYSPLACFLLFLTAGICFAYKIGAADKLFHLAHNL